MTYHRIPEIKCLACDSKLNSAGDLNDGTHPHPNDITICLFCEHFMAFNDDLTLRELTEEEHREAEKDQGVMDVLGMVQMYRVLNKRKHH